MCDIFDKRSARSDWAPYMKQSHQAKISICKHLVCYRHTTTLLPLGKPLIGLNAGEREGRSALAGFISYIMKS